MLCSRLGRAIVLVEAVEYVPNVRQSGGSKRGGALRGWVVEAATPRF